MHGATIKITYMLILKIETLHSVYQMQGVFGMMGFTEVNWI
jgi:hypothetical protein